MEKNLTSMKIRTASDANEDSRKRFVTDARRDGCSKRWTGTNGKARTRMRLIDADKATEVVGYFLEQMGIALFGRNGKDLARTLLLQVPTIDAVSVVHGKWIDKGADLDGTLYYQCSNCHADVIEEQYPNCPYCLARMKGADDERHNIDAE